VGRVHYRIRGEESSAAVAAAVAKCKPASTISSEQNDRQLSAGANGQTGPWLAPATDSDSAQRREHGVIIERCVALVEQVSVDLDTSLYARLIRPQSVHAYEGQVGLVSAFAAHRSLEATRGSKRAGSLALTSAPATDESRDLIGHGRTVHKH